MIGRCFFKQEGLAKRVAFGYPLLLTHNHHNHIKIVTLPLILLSR